MVIWFWVRRSILFQKKWFYLHLGLQSLFCLVFLFFFFSPKWTIQHQTKQAACPPVHGWLNDGFDRVWEGRKMKSQFYGVKRILALNLLLFLKYSVLYRFSSSTEQSSTRLMRRHRRRRRKPKASNMDRVRPQKPNQQHKHASSYLNISLFSPNIPVLFAVLIVQQHYRFHYVSEHHHCHSQHG